MRSLLVALLLLAAACQEPAGAVVHTERAAAAVPPEQAPAEEEEEVVSGDAAEEEVVAEAPAAPTCDSPIPIYADGARAGEVCEEALADRGLTAIDLSDDWTASIFNEDPTGTVPALPYRDVIIALANERFEDLPEDFEPERFLELFGIFPTLSVMRERLADDSRHSCHASIENDALERLSGTLRPWAPTREEQVSRANSVRYLRHRLGRLTEELGLSSITELDGHPEHGRHYAQLERQSAFVDSIEAARAHLECEGLHPQRGEYGVFDTRLSGQLAKYQRMHMIVSGGLLDEATRRAFRQDSREQDFDTLLRMLRERVVSATGLIEDGSAQREWGDALGRSLDAPEFRHDARQPAAENGAPDLISPATAAAAQALGFTSVASARESLRALAEAHVDHVAIALPALPAYHRAHMELRTEIDRGDVFYQYPYDDEGRRRRQLVSRRPIFTLYTRHQGTDIALVRWSTTIGGWKTENVPGGGTALRYKNSSVGERVWRDVIAAPAWLPPRSAPDKDLVRRTETGWAPNHGLFGPGYRSAFGLVMMMHHKVVPSREADAPPRFLDEGIRVHGSVSYRSITSGTSHGCHRLFNHLAVRVSSFVLDHRRHTRHGSLDVRYSRNVRHRGRAMTFRIRSRGYRYELTPPVPVRVLSGRIRGPISNPITGYRVLPSRVAAEARRADSEG